MLADISFTFVDGRAIFLDLRNDRYLMLSDAQSEALARVCNGEVTRSSDEQALEPLVARGLLPQNKGATRVAQCRSPNPATASWLDQVGPRSWGMALQCAVRTAYVSRKLKITPICKVLHEAQIGAKSAPAIPKGSPAVLLTAFHWSGAILPPTGRCLARSVALAALMHARGHACDIVVGVMRRPFMAHCWVQSGEMVLNDSLDAVRPFTPILVI